MTFDIRQLRYAVAAADHGSFHRAALALEIEQSSLSRRINKLERVVGVKLFRRSRAGVTPTSAGAEFIRNARHILVRADQLIVAMRAAGQGRVGALAIGYRHPISAGNLRATLVEWKQRHPEVIVDRVENDRHALIAALDAGVIDIAILIGEERYSDLRRASLWSERVLLAMPDSHPLAEREHITLSDLREETVIMAAEDPGAVACGMMTGCFRDAGISPTIRVQHVAHESILNLLGAGGGIALTCEGASGARYPDVSLRDIHGPQGQLWLGFSGYWRKENDNPALRRFLAFVRNRYALSFEIGSPPSDNSQLSGEPP